MTLPKPKKNIQVQIQEVENGYLVKGGQPLPGEAWRTFICTNMNDIANAFFDIVCPLVTKKEEEDEHG